MNIDEIVYSCEMVNRRYKSNSTYGALKNQYNVLYQPTKANHICISGQLFLTDLIEKLEEIPSFKLIQANTDGLMIGYQLSDERLVNEIVLEWESRTRLKMEYTEIKKIVQSNVNNYVIIAGATYMVNDDFSKTVTKQDKSKISVKGGLVSLFYGGDFKNNSLAICHKAVVNYFIHDKSIEDTINESEDILDFQMIAKTGASYDGTVYRSAKGDEIVQKVNRVYASKDKTDGCLYKVKDDNGRKRFDKVANLPSHCIIDNGNEITIDKIDKTFYIDLARDWMKSYIGDEKPKAKKKRSTKDMTTRAKEEKMNIYAKLAVSKAQFGNSGVTKSGINRYADFKYFELADIVPVANQILLDNGLLFITSFTDESAIGTLIDCESPEDRIIFTSPARKLETVSASGKTKMNDLQALGAEQTYQRRYLYLMLFDIVESDTFDKKLGNEESNEPTETVSIKATKKKATPKTPEQRKVIAEDIAKGSETKSATELQKTSIREGLNKLREAGDDEDYITKVVAKMKKGCSETEAIDILNDITKRLYGEEA